MQSKHSDEMLSSTTFSIVVKIITEVVLAVDVPLRPL